MSEGEISDDREVIKEAARNGLLTDVIRLSTKFSTDIELLSEALIWSCKEDQLKVVKWLVEHSIAEVNFTGQLRIQNAAKEEVTYYFTPLTAACCYGHLDVVKYLVETSRVDVNLRESGKWGHTPLIHACVNENNISVSMYLLREVSDLNVNITDREGDTALGWVVWSCKDSGHTPLHKACIEGNVDEVKKLVCLGDLNMLNTQDNVGYTPLHWTCYYGHVDIVKILVLMGADAKITDIDKKSSAQVAAERGHTDLLKLLDRDSLFEVLQKAKKLTKMTVGFLMMMTLQPLKHKLVRKKWCHLVAVVHVGLISGKSHVNKTRQI